MKTKQLLEAEKATVAFAFGRFNPAHQGHIEVWRAVEQAGQKWFIGTNPSTLGPNDPLTFEQKSAWMAEIYPPIQGHIVPQTSVLTLAAYIFKKLRNNDGASIAYVTDDTDWAWSGKLLNQYNGQEGAHGYYKFAQITHVPSPRVSSATALRDAARADDKVAFYHASGTDPKAKVAGLSYFDTVKQACEKYPLPVKRAKKVTESLNEFAPDGFNGGDDGEEFSPEIAKMAQEDGFTKGAGLADGATLERAMAINYWHSQHGGMYKQYFAKGFKAGRMDKIRHNNKQYNLNLQLMKDGSIRHGEQGMTEMDSQGYTGSRDDYELGKGKEHTGKSITADKMIKAAKKAWDYATEPVDAPNMDTYKKHRAKNIANIRKNKVSEDEQGETGHETGNQLIPWPTGTTKVHVSDVYDWYKLGQVISDLDDADPKQFGQGQPQTVIAFGSEEEESKLLPLLKRLGLKVDDIDPKNSDIDEAYHAGSLYDYLKNTKQDMSEEKQRLDAKCWTGYKKQGTKMKGGVRVNNCVKESALDEKSVSKAQFRTMAAVANNPEFAKKVGISQAVGKEFHSADKNTNYKKLPKKVDEVLDPTTMSANVLRYLGRKFATAFPWIATGAMGAGLAYSGLLAPIMASAGGAAATLTSLGAETALAAGVAGTYAAPSVIQVIKDLFAADENSIQAGIKRWVEKHVGDESDIQEFLNLHAQSAYLKQPVFRWRAEEWKTKMNPKEAEAYLEKHNKGWLDAEKQKVIDAEKAKADAEKKHRFKVSYYDPKTRQNKVVKINARNKDEVLDYCANKGYTDVTVEETVGEGLDADQKRAGQVAGEEDAKKIGPVLAKPTKQHPYKGRLVGEAEDFNGEYDDEAGMARSNLLTTGRAVAGLLKTIQDNDNLPEWGQEKIAKAEMMLVSIWDYLQSQKEQGIDPKVEGVTEAEIDFGPEWDEIVNRVGQRAKQGPLKTVWDEKKRVYKNVPVNDPDQPSKEVDEASLATMRDYFAGNDDAKDPTKLAQMRDFFNKNKLPSTGVKDKRFASKQAYELWLKQNGLRDLSSK